MDPEIGSKMTAAKDSLELEAIGSSATKCVVCDSLEWKRFLRFERFPLYIGTLSREKAMRNRYWSLEAGLCQGCGHGQQMAFPPNEWLSSIYEEDYSCNSPVLTGIGSELADCFLSFLVPKLPLRRPLRILEIGCFDGYTLNRLKQLGHDVEGCDPSQGASIARNRLGIPVRREFFRAGLYAKASFDVVIMRHLIEHLTTPRDFLQAVVEALRPNGVLALETPNYVHSIERHQWGDFHIEHVSFFTPASLRKLLLSAGMTLAGEHLGHFMFMLGSREGSDNLLKGSCDQNNVLEVKQLNHLVEGFQQKAEKFSSDLRSIVCRLRREGKRLAIYGAGGHTTTMWALQVASSDQIAYVVDGDARKWGRWTAGFNLEVHPPERLIREPVDYILLSSDMYEKEMAHYIREELHLSTPVIRLYPEIKVMEDA